MQKWEYRVVELETPLDPGTGLETAVDMLEAELDEFGYDGWEVASMQQSVRKTLVAFLKRPKP